MHISDNTIDLFMDINEFSGNALKNREVVLNLLELSAQNETNKNIFNELIFAGKYTDGMMNIINNKSPDEKTKEYLNAELSKNFEKIVKLLKDISGGAAASSKNLIQIELPNADHSDDVTFYRTEDNNELSAIQKLFSERFYELTPQTLLNLISLSTDLALIKKYYNQGK
ncbi:hypothetical protein BH10BAC5_BH10BAC5_27070 [soil metagenome]